MKIKNTSKLIAFTLMNTGASTAFAHEGHGMLGSHWHATDVLGFVVVVLALAVWLTRGGK